ncbi:MAG: hypothetical protein IJX72_04075 [Clostridia bacterium]|nr:hypothetical protein [Clostridia bacterium]
MKGILAYQAFNQISDTFVDESYIPGAEVLLAPPSRRTRKTRGEREESALRRFMNSGWGVACISLFVAFSVLAGIIWAGRQDPTGIPSVGTSPKDTLAWDTSAVTTEALTTRLPEETAPETTFDQDTTLGPETVYPDEPIVEPDVESVLAQAEPMAPDIPAGSALVGETALTMWYAEDGSNLKKQVSRIAVYRDGDDPYTHYLYADVLTNSGKIRKTETRTIHGFFVLLESDSGLILSTVEGEPIDQGNCTVYGLMEMWYSWTDADAMTAEDIGDVRILREEYENWTRTAGLEKLDQTLLMIAGRYWDALSTRVQKDGGAENAGVLVDFFTVTDTPRVYAYSDSKGADATAARKLILDGTHFETAWSAFARRISDQAAGKDPAPPTPEETTSWEDYAEPMEPDVPADAVEMGYTYTTDHVTKDGETFEAISRIALYGFRGDESSFYLYRDVLGENGEIIASHTVTLPTLFGLAQNSLDGSLQLYTVTADRDNSGVARLGLTVQTLHWSDQSPAGEDVGEVKAWVTPCEEASWTWEDSNKTMFNKGMDYCWQVHATAIGDCWLQSTQTYWNQTLGELGMEDSGYLTFLMDKLLNVNLGDMYIFHPEDDEETRMGTYFFLSTGTDHLNRWFQYCMSGLGFMP